MQCCWQAILCCCQPIHPEDLYAAVMFRQESETPPLFPTKCRNTRACPTHELRLASRRVEKHSTQHAGSSVMAAHHAGVTTNFPVS